MEWVRQAAIFRWEGVRPAPPIPSPGLRHPARGRWRKALQSRTVRRDQPVAGGILRGLGGRVGIDSSGVLGLVRDPWYTAVVLLLWARDLDMAALVGNGLRRPVNIVVGTLLEERKLVYEFGDAYRSYQGRVSMFLPLKWIQRRIAPGLLPAVASGGIVFFISYPPLERSKVHLGVVASETAVERIRIDRESEANHDLIL